MRGVAQGKRNPQLIWRPSQRPQNQRCPSRLLKLCMDLWKFDIRILILCCSTRLLFPYVEPTKFIQCVSRAGEDAHLYLPKIQPPIYVANSLSLAFLRFPAPWFQGASLLIFDTQTFPAPCYFEKIYDGLSLSSPKENWTRNGSEPPEVRIAA